jgi:hypothetical protein
LLVRPAHRLGLGRAIWPLLVPIVLSGCGPADDGCEPEGCFLRASLSVYFDAELEDVVGAETEICMDGECARIFWLPLADDGSSFSSALGDGSSVRLSESGIGGLVLEVGFGEIADREERTVGIGIVKSSGAVVLDVSRTLVLDSYPSCGATCVTGSEYVDLRGSSDAGVDG